MSNLLIKLNLDVLMICLEFMSLKDIREFDNAAEFSSNHDHLLEAMHYAKIDDLDEQIDILMFCWLKERCISPISFHFEGVDIETWHDEITNINVNVTLLNPFRNVEHIDFDRLLAIPIREGIDRTTLFQLIIDRCDSVIATDNTGKPK